MHTLLNALPSKNSIHITMKGKPGHVQAYLLLKVTETWSFIDF